MDIKFILLLLILPVLSFGQAFYRLKYYLLSVEIMKDHLLIVYMKYNKRISLEDKIENFTIKKKHAKYNNHRDFYLIITYLRKQIKLRQFQTLDWNENVMDEFINAFEDKSIHLH